jgi:hypothetical protein
LEHLKELFLQYLQQYRGTTHAWLRDGIGPELHDLLWKYLIDAKLALILSSAIYIFFAMAIAKIWFEDHHAKMERLHDPSKAPIPHAYPPGYFGWLAVQTAPLMITGIALDDGFIFVTRAATLMIVLPVWAAIKNPTGVYDFKKSWHWVFLYFAIPIFGGTLWFEYPQISQFVKEYSFILSLIFGIPSIAVALLFFWWGQRPTAKHVWERKREYNLKGFWVQVARFTSFELQAFFYISTVSLFDVRSINGLITGMGAFIIILTYLWKMLWHRPSRVTEARQTA